VRKILLITLLSVVLIACFVLTGCSTELTDQYVLEEKEEVISSDEFESILRYPVVTGLVDKKVEEKINGTIKERIDGFKRGLENFKQIPEMQDNTLDVTYEVGYRTKEILSIKIEVISHMRSFGVDDHVVIGKNFDLKTGELLSLKDILKGNYKEEIDAKLEVKFSELDVEVTKQFEGINDETVFYIKDNALVFCFSAVEYINEIGETLELEIPFSEISGFLKKPLAFEGDTSPELKNYNTAIDEETKPSGALFFIGENIRNASQKDATTMILSFEEIQEKYIGVYEEILIDNEVQQKLFEFFGDTFDKDRVSELEDADLKSLLQEIIDGGYMVVNAEGLFTIVQDYRVLEEYAGYLSDDIRDYIYLKAEESKDLESLKAGGVLPWAKIKDRLMKYEDYMETYPDSIKEYEAGREHMNLLHTFFFGFNGMPAFDYATNKINDELLENYREFVNMNKSSETAKMIEGYLEVLERNNYTLCEEVEEYRRSFSSINENNF
jgi:hypothetical protein